MYAWNHAEGHWDAVYQIGNVPKPKYHSTLAELPGTRTAYLFGGNSEEPVSSDFYKLDLETLSWTFIGYAPVPPRFAAGMVGVNGMIYIGFGNNALGVVISDMWRYDPSTSQWTQISTAGNLQFY